MARRAGKAATRKARQRKSQRPQSAAVSPPAPSTAGVVAAPEVVTSAPAPRPAPARSNLTAPSQLTATERTEYHYVERDLRDIGILTLVMTVLLLAAWFAFRAFGLLG